MASEKAKFLKDVTVIIDTREQENSHIIESLESLNVKYEKRKLDLGDYSFSIAGKDFSMSCVIERKANVNELYGNITQDRERIEKEFESANKSINQFVLLLEGVLNMDRLKNVKVSDRDMEKQKRKVQNIGEKCYYTLQSWQCSNKYNFRTIFVKDNANTAAKILEQFYYYWRNYKELTRSRKL